MITIDLIKDIVKVINSIENPVLKMYVETYIKNKFGISNDFIGDIDIVCDLKKRIANNEMENPEEYLDQISEFLNNVDKRMNIIKNKATNIDENYVKSLNEFINAISEINFNYYIFDICLGISRKYIKFNFNLPDSFNDNKMFNVKKSKGCFIVSLNK